MLFSSPTFVFVFLPIFLAAISIARRLGYGIYLAALTGFSLYLYAFHIPVYVVLLLASAVVNYVLSGRISDHRNRPLYVLGIAGNIAALAYFKYAGFLVTNVEHLTGWQIKFSEIALPLAISFITFEQIAFLSDVHFGRIARGNPIQYFAFITLFPKLIAGPIIRYTEILPQLSAKQSVSAHKVFTGFCIFSFGLFKKTVLADPLAPFADRTFAAAAEETIHASDAFFGTLAYAGRIYFDFSGYSVMAIGIAWMFGVRLPINFLSPYRSRSIIEFWRRWHITLSTFLRDYIYIPLGGNRQGELRRYRNLILTMLIGGIWHGAGWVFVVWGALHGTALAVNHLWRRLKIPSVKFLSGTLSWILTMSVVLISWIFFNAAGMTAAGNMLLSFGDFAPLALLSDGDILHIIGIFALAVILPSAATIYRYEFSIDEPDWGRLPPIPIPPVWLSTLSATVFVLAVINIFSGTLNEFIYFQF